MLNRWPLVVSGGMLAYAAYEWAGMQADLGTISDQLNEIGIDFMNSISGYSYDRVPVQYRDAISQAEAANGLPDQMLARLLWQECRYRASIIDGRTVSSAGALGIAQFMPATAADMGIDPLDPYQAIAAAGRYLRSLYRQTGDWAKTLAAYNWGIGNVLKKGLSKAPLETRNYYTQILNDIGMGATYA